MPTERNEEASSTGPDMDGTKTPSIYVDNPPVLENRVTGKNKKKCPEDCYSLLAFYEPIEPNRNKCCFFLFGLLPFLFQVSLFALLLRNVLDQGNDNPGSGEDGFLNILATFIPSNVDRTIRGTQLVSMAAYVVFPQSGLLDIVRAVQLIPRFSEAKACDPMGRMTISCLLRGLQGILAVFAALLLVLSTNKVVDIILNFTAVNFISNLDDYAFRLAMSGEFGSVLKAETERIANTDLPACVSRASKRVYYKIVAGLIYMILFGMLIFVIAAQESDDVWATEILRVQFNKGTGLEKYSGCFLNKESRFSQRRIYGSYPGVAKSSFGYCRENRQWILFKESEDILDPCDAATAMNDLEVAHSSSTDTFDISSSFGDLWVSAMNTPLDLFFFDGGNEVELACDTIAGDDGICAPFFNNPSFGFDGGDCCAATCTQPNCGREGPMSVFGNSDSFGVGFPNCKDTEMVPITIRLNDISSSRNPEFAEYDSNWESEYGVTENEWRTKTPENPSFALDCNGKNILTVNIIQTMVDSSETVMVQDGADCTLVVSKVTTNSPQDIAVDDPIWFINFTILHGEKNGAGNEKIEILSQSILSQSSSENKIVNFKRIPECYFRKLKSHIDIGSIYTASGRSNQVIDWLLEDSTDVSSCEDKDFLERYAFASMMFALTGGAKFMNRLKLCSWSMVGCSEDKINRISLPDEGLQGEIPSEIGLLTNLQEIDLNNNQISSIPSEIGLLTSLQVLDLSGTNQILSIPSEIGLLTSLQYIYLDVNQISSIPSEIGMITGLKRLDLSVNQITSIPSEIGLLTSLQYIYLEGNPINLDDLPREVTELCSSSTSITQCDFDGLVSIPAEIELNTMSLTSVYLGDEISESDDSAGK